MKVGVAQHKDKELLYDIQNTLMTQWVDSKTDVQKTWERFSQAIKKNSDQLAYGYMQNSKGQIVLIASLHAEYKLTRNLCTCYHLQIIYRQCSHQDEAYFHKEVIKMLPAYKVTGLGVSESEVFKPNQVFMDICCIDDKNKGSL